MGSAKRLISALAVVYAVFLLYTAGPEYLFVLRDRVAPGTVLFVVAPAVSNGRGLLGPPRRRLSSWSSPLLPSYGIILIATNALL